jgi:hypothetical protein
MVWYNMTMCLQEHHDLSLMLLAGRSMPDGLPWSYDDDRAYILQERQLWALLTEEEQKQEQAFLETLWKSPNKTILVNPMWGKWTGGLVEIQVDIKSFGTPHKNFRPDPKGPLVEEHPGYTQLVKWLWDKGFQVIDITNGWIRIPVHEKRIQSESLRLVGLLHQTFPQIAIKPLGCSPLAMQAKAIYDPVSGLAYLELFGLDDFIAYGM